MAIPAYLWLKDVGGMPIQGSVAVKGREGAIEIIGINHGVMQPTDMHSGKATGLRAHSPFSFIKRSMHRALICIKPLRLVSVSNLQK